MDQPYPVLRLLKWIFRLVGWPSLVIAIGSLVLTYLSWASAQGPADWTARPGFPAYLAWQVMMAQIAAASLFGVTLAELIQVLLDRADAT